MWESSENSAPTFSDECRIGLDRADLGLNEGHHVCGVKQASVAVGQHSPPHQAWGVAGAGAVWRQTTIMKEEQSVDKEMEQW